MRVLFTFVGGTGHSEPMVPVAKSLLDAGHNVAFAGDQRYLSRLSQQGFDVITADSAAWVPERRQELVEPDQAHEDDVVQNHYVGEVPRRRIETYQRLFADWQPTWWSATRPTLAPQLLPRSSRFHVSRS